MENEILRQLLEDLEDFDHQVREQARHKLVSLGKGAMPILSEAVLSDNPNLRWQAAKVISLLDDPAVIPDLLEIIEENPHFGVRWAASDGLIHLGREALVPLFQHLMDHPDSVWLRESALHILHSLRDRNVESDAINTMITALTDILPEVEIPRAGLKALELLSG